MREDLKQIIDQLGEEDVYLLYVAALEMKSRRGQGTTRGGTIKGGNQ